MWLQELFCRCHTWYTNVLAFVYLVILLANLRKQHPILYIEDVIIKLKLKLKDWKYSTSFADNWNHPNWKKKTNLHNSANNQILLRSVTNIHFLWQASLIIELPLIGSVMYKMLPSIMFTNTYTFSSKVRVGYKQIQRADIIISLSESW